MRPLRPLRRRASRLLLAVLTAASAGCVDWGGPDVDTDAYNIAREGWESQSPSAYEYTLTRTCPCTSERQQSVTITVRDGAVVERRYVSSGTAVPAAEAPYFPTIDDLFDELRELLDAGASQQQVYYNGAWGYPYQVAIVPNAGQSASVTGWVISGWRQI